MFQNAFFLLANANPYRALSFDDLHFDDSGIWGDHIFEELKKHILQAGRDASTALDNRFVTLFSGVHFFPLFSNRFKSFPRWSGLHYFKDGVMKLSFNDGSKHRDISKVLEKISTKETKI